MSIGYFNGEFIPIEQTVIPIEERGHQFGDGVYEVVRVYNGKFFMLEEHIQRLFKSAKAIHLQIDQSAKELQTIIHEAVGKSGLSDCDVYLQISRGIASRNHLFPDAPVSISMTVKPMRVISESVRQDGKKAVFYKDERWANCYIKSLNLLPNILAKQFAHDSGCYEAILVKDGFVTEGTSSNVFMISNHTLYTTPLSNQILPGITRMAVKDIANTLQIPFVEKQFTAEELLKADEVFITSTTNEIMPIVEIESQKIKDGTSGKLTLELIEKFMESVGLVQHS